MNDASAYLLKSVLLGALASLGTVQNEYTIIDDVNATLAIDKDISNPKIIYASDFGERAMEYVNATYANKQIINDKIENGGINSYEWTTERTDVTATSCKIVSTLTVDTSADFSKLLKYEEKMLEKVLKSDITKENADYVINLKVGQKCKVDTKELSIGYEMYGGTCKIDKIADNCIEIVGENVGKANGYFQRGETKKSFYVTVEENTENANLETILLNIDEKPAPVTEEKKEEKKDTTVLVENNTVVDDGKAKTNLPKTGVNSIIYLVIGLGVASIIIFGVKLRKNKDIK